MTSRLALALVMLAGLSLAARAQLPGPLVRESWLAANLDKVVVLDVRDGADTFLEEGHIPGAVLVEWRDVRSRSAEDGTELEDMLPSKEAFAALMQRSGVNADSAIVITSRGLRADEMFLATRLYWQLKFYGHDAMAVLDGGTGAWSVHGHKLVRGPMQPRPTGNWAAKAERRELLASTRDVLAAMSNRQPALVDARNIQKYLGLARDTRLVAADGHIPGARHADARYFILDAKPVLFRNSEEIARIAAGLSLETRGPSITYCDTGDWASGTWFVLSELLGSRRAALYDGSMHAWSKRRELPVTRFKMD